MEVYSCLASISVVNFICIDFDFCPFFFFVLICVLKLTFAESGPLLSTLDDWTTG